MLPMSLPPTPDDVIVPPEPLSQRRKRPVEKEALLALSQVLARDPAAAMQGLVDLAMKNTQAGSAGVSIEEADGPEPVFRWIATAGEFTRYLHGTMPRHASPCGTVLERGRALLMRDPGRCYRSIDSAHVPVRHALLVPFSRRGKLVGTVWVLRHSGIKGFTSDDVRAVDSLTTFATAILDSLEARQARAA